MSTRDRIIAHLDRDYTEPVRDPLWKHIHLSEGMVHLIDSRQFQQLHRIKQLGPSYLVYPGATHSRLSHSLGVFHISRRIIRALIAFDSCMELSQEGVKAFLCAALLHDVGHFPFAHSLKDLPLKDHEQLTGDLIESAPIRDIIRDRVGADPELAAAIVDHTRPEGGSQEVLFFRHILSGTLDPDKLDYLNRDAYYCGVPYGIQDIDFAIGRMRPHGASGLAMEESGSSAIEHILFSKYLMYRAVYWHRTVRVATAMIKKALFLALNEGVIRPVDLYGLDDDQFVGRMSGIDFAPFALISDVSSRTLHHVVWEAPFGDSNPAHAMLMDLEVRSALEERIAQRIRKRGIEAKREDVILDIPEHVSFEMTMPVVRDGRVMDYMESGTVFTRKVIEDFTSTLRRIRFMVSPRLVDRIPAPEELLEEL